MVPSHLTAHLSAAADTEINTVLCKGAPGQSPPTGEVGFVAAFVLGAVHGIASQWRSILRPHRLSVCMTGVFCHQSPKARFIDQSGTPKVCELSDLLVVAEDLTGGGTGKRYAVLIQAKIANRGGGATLSATGDLTQLDLMTRWPSFSLPSPYAPGDRDFSTCSYPGTTIECGRYGLIEPRPNVDWRQHAPDTKMAGGSVRLGSFLGNMIATGQSGYGREATGTGDDWSRTVDELIHVAGTRAFSYAAGFQGQRQRGSYAIALASSSDLSFWASPWLSHAAAGRIPTGGRPDDPEQLEREPGAQGISVLHIGVTEIGEDEA